MAGGRLGVGDERGVVGIGVAVALLVAFPWMLQVLIEFFQNLLIGMPEMLR